MSQGEPFPSSPKESPKTPRRRSSLQNSTSITERSEISPVQSGPVLERGESLGSLRLHMRFLDRRTLWAAIVAVCALVVGGYFLTNSKL